MLAHEIGHYKKRHVLIGTMLSAIETALFLGLFSLLTKQTGLFAAFDVDTPSFYAGLVFVSILLRPMQYRTVGRRRGAVAAARASGRRVRRRDHRAAPKRWRPLSSACRRTISTT